MPDVVQLLTLFGVVIQIVATAYTYGRLTQRVVDNEQRLNRMERIMDRRLHLSEDLNNAPS